MTTFRTDFTTHIETFDYLQSIDAENLTHEGKLALLIDFSTSKALIESIIQYIRPDKFGNSYHYEELLKNLIETNQLAKLKNCHASLSPLFDTELYDYSLYYSNNEVRDYLRSVIEVDYDDINITQLILNTSGLKDIKSLFEHFIFKNCNYIDIPDWLDTKESVLIFTENEKKRTFEEFLFLVSKLRQDLDYVNVLRNTQDCEFACKLYDHYISKNLLSTDNIFELLQDLSTYNNEPEQAFRIDIINHILNDLSDTDFNQIFPAVLTLNCFHLDNSLFDKFINTMSFGNRNQLFIETFKSLNLDFFEGIEFIPEVEEYESFREFYSHEEEVPELVNYVFNTFIMPKKVASF